MSHWERSYRAMLRVVEGSLVLLTGALAVVVPVGVFFRYVLGSALAWTDELGAFLLAWITYLGGVVALHRNSHMGFDNLLQHLPPGLRAAVVAGADLAMAAFFLVLLWGGLHISVQLAAQQAISLPLPMGLVYGVMPLSALLMLWVLAFKHAPAWQLAWRKLRQGVRQTPGLEAAAKPASPGPLAASPIMMEAPEEVSRQ